MAKSTDSGIAAATTSKRGTALILVCNCIGVLCVLYAFFSSLFLYSSASLQPVPDNIFNKIEATRIQIHVQEALEARKANEPVELIKRVKEIQREVYIPLKDGTFPETKKKSAPHRLAGRLKQIQKSSAKKNLQALEEWRKKKLESSNAKVEMAASTENLGPVPDTPSRQVQKAKSGAETLKIV